MHCVDKVEHLWRLIKVHLHTANSSVVPPRVKTLQFELLKPVQVLQDHGHGPIVLVKSTVARLPSRSFLCEMAVLPNGAFAYFYFLDNFKIILFLQ